MSGSISAAPPGISREGGAAPTLQHGGCELLRLPHRPLRVPRRAHDRLPEQRRSLARLADAADVGSDRGTRADCTRSGRANRGSAARAHADVRPQCPRWRAGPRYLGQAAAKPGADPHDQQREAPEGPDGLRRPASEVGAGEGSTHASWTRPPSRRTSALFRRERPRPATNASRSPTSSPSRTRLVPPRATR